MKVRIGPLILTGLLLLGVSTTGLAQNTPIYDNNIPGSAGSWRPGEIELVE